MRVVLCTPTVKRPHPAYLEALEATAHAFPDLDCVFEIGCPYISAARTRMLGKAMERGFDYVVFVDHDVSWRPEDFRKLLSYELDVVGGTYRFKHEKEEYMGAFIVDENNKVHAVNGLIRAERLPAGFLKVSRRAIDLFAERYPELICARDKPPSVDIFNHGAHDGQWWGEDYAFCRRYREIGDVWLIPDLNLDHHAENKAYPGNFHQFLLRCPGGSEDPEISKEAA